MPSRPPSVRARFALAAALLLLAALGCVDPDARYDAFLERSAPQRRARDAGGMAQPSERFDFSGRYLLALSVTLSPDQPILLGCDVAVAQDLATLELSFQPLSIDDDPMPRMPVAESITVSAIPYEEDGSFSADLGEVTVPARANPISGSDIVATVAIDAVAQRTTDALPVFFCGDASGMVSVPLELDLAGSTIGAVAVDADSFEGVEPLARCPDG
jgi:hypothetical protein